MGGARARSTLCYQTIEAAINSAALPLALRELPDSSPLLVPRPSAVHLG